MKNVLLLCMSTVKKDIKKSKYSCENMDDYVDGYMTNEAPTKAVIKQLSQLEEGQRVDRIVMICSETVYQKIDVDTNESPIEHPEELSHIEFYKQMVNTFAESTDSDYKDNPIEYVEVSIPDFTEAHQVSQAVIDAANKVIDLDDDVQLYLDFNGGQRYVAFMLVAISNLMKNRRVDIKQVMTMNYETRIKVGEERLVPIQNMAPVFRSFDLISGINEYINYGRTKGLKTYFARTKNEEIKSVLNEMEKFVNNLQLCRTGYILREKGKLRKTLEEYSAKEKFGETLTAYEQLFLYVVKDILDGYRGILDGDLPGIIKWCVERDFVQQALTFCVEEMPDYFWRENIFTATEQEKKEYNCFLNMLKKNRDCFSRMQSDYRDGDTKEESSKYAYNWMIKYLIFSYEKPEYKTIFLMAPRNVIKLAYENVDRSEISKKQKSLMEFKVFDMSGVKVNKNQMETAAKSASKLVYFKMGKRVHSANVKLRDLSEILMIYFLLKEQRNVTNHASGGHQDGTEWTCDELCFVLKQLSTKLIGLKRD